ncbi:hypothetical protein At15955_53480 (plasmid) [Agrobacterium tumefaciens]|uniref:TraA-like protein n=2 Tax=Agrobacterium tumefaciens TaxID=358 RepID=Q9F450_AGRTU|nr:hypothetical protein At15955_53480 [Agrobacterium tumefaciens]CUX06776.1 TraA-like protein [Agrobacterium fabacearum TT111]CVI25575.1 TraA-like protein [Agrobacterium tumefaciens str. B6]AYM71635.1 conjugal transfer protein TraA [Agrobacterium tumefaciens]CAC15179.1 TraA-like protein [Agrobacterium tumefaciens]
MPPPGLLVTVHEYGWLGVDIFFVLSGYLIGTQLFKEISRTGAVDFKSFYLRRAFHIFPAFFVVLGLYALVPVLRDNPAMQPLWKFATFMVNLGFDPRVGNALSQAWTLTVEEQFYLVLPLLVLLPYRRIGTGWVVALAGLLMLAGAMLRYERGQLYRDALRFSETCGLNIVQVARTLVRDRLDWTLRQKAKLVDLGKRLAAFAARLGMTQSPTTQMMKEAAPMVAGIKTFSGSVSDIVGDRLRTDPSLKRQWEEVSARFAYVFADPETAFRAMNFDALRQTRRWQSRSCRSWRLSRDLSVH